MSVETDAKGFVSAQPELAPTRAAKRISEINLEDVPIIKEVGVKPQFKERDLLVDKLEYPRNGTEQGLVLIFNQASFEDKEKRYRTGSRRDVNEIIECMGRLGHNINDNHIFMDLTREEVLAELDQVVSGNILDSYNSVIVFFLTHGDSADILYTKDSHVNANEVWQKFGNCKFLQGKPKMFVFQACKGDNYSKTPTTKKPLDPMDLVSSHTFQSDYITPDMLIVYAATEGNVSMRNPLTGTWFIQELCKNLSSYGRRDDVVSIITRTTKCICKNYYVEEHGEIKKQAPVYISTLRKRFYLNVNKDRHLLLKTVEDQGTVITAIEKLQKNLKLLFNGR